jgi:hypothetical protein
MTDSKTTPKSTPKDAPKKAPARSGYVVLHSTRDTEWSVVVTGVVAATPLAAIRQVHGDTGGTYRAVPMRSWHKPITVELETRTVPVYR